MICGGDELGRTQRGNNNAYCQDNELSWVDWSHVGPAATVGRPDGTGALPDPIRTPRPTPKPCSSSPGGWSACAEQPRLPPPELVRRAAHRPPGQGEELADIAWFAPSRHGDGDRELGRRAGRRCLAVFVNGRALQSRDSPWPADHRRQLPAAAQRLDRRRAVHAARRSAWAPCWSIEIDTVGARRRPPRRRRRVAPNGAFGSPAAGRGCCKGGDTVAVQPALAATAPRAPADAAPAGRSARHLPPAAHAGVRLRRRRRRGGLPGRPRRHPCLPLALPAGRARLHPRLRRGRPQPGQRRAGRAGRPPPPRRRRSPATAWARCSTSSPTTWRSGVPPPTAGGGTCWSTGRPAGSPTTSTSTGSSPEPRPAGPHPGARPRRPLRRALEAGELRLERDGAAGSLSLLRAPLPRLAPLARLAAGRRRASQAHSAELAFLADSLGALPRGPPPSTTSERARRQRDLAVARRPAGAAGRRGARRGRRARRARSSGPQRRPRPARSRCSASSTTAWPTGGWRPRSSTTAASSTSPASPPCAPNGPRCSRTPIGCCWSGCAAGDVDGLRIDHPDGLRDPEGYLARLAEAAPGRWIVVEKILERDEALPAWPVAGTTGYDFLQPGRRAVRRPRRRGAADPALRRGHRPPSDTARTDEIAGLVVAEQAASCCAARWPPT